ncbi:MAG: CPBP family intramembrane metalloprotease [Caldilinea sp.]|nr:CPBP family intramembrane metalloprotease [Caldilinea sp.]
MSEVLGVIIQFLPVILILFIANLAERLREQEQPYMPLAVLAYVSLGLLYGVLALLGLGALFVPAGLQAQPDLQEQLNTIVPVQSWAWLSWGILIPSLAGLLLLLKPVRRWLAGFSTLDAANPVHAVSVSMTMFIPIYLAFTLGIGLNNLATQIATQVEETGRQPVTVGLLWVQTALFVLIALVGVGWLTRRSFKESLVRLGVVAPTTREVLIAVGVALLLVPAVMLLEAGANLIGLGADADVESLTEQLIGPLFQTPLGILSIGLAAGIGEEIVFRGAMQPRFSLVLTALLFALLHSNYGITLSTGIVFLLGVVLGIIRSRFNTSTAMITHAVYNSTLALLASLAGQFLSNQ